MCHIFMDIVPPKTTHHDNHLHLGDAVVQG